MYLQKEMMEKDQTLLPSLPSSGKQEEILACQLLVPTKEHIGAF